jgi:hypothetical protein
MLTLSSLSVKNGLIFQSVSKDLQDNYPVVMLFILKFSGI